MTTTSAPRNAAAMVDLTDIQGGILHPRTTPYVGAHLLLRIDDQGDGRRPLGRLSGTVVPAEDWSSDLTAWTNVAITYQGLLALGVPQSSLDTLAPEFRGEVHSPWPSSPTSRHISTCC